ncbi:MAG: DEAD/DEAH box helicase [Candidatus Izemoplasmatales bacterium]|jgi:ATP-dependent RNA helicase CshB
MVNYKHYIVSALEALKFIDLTEVQQKVIPNILEGKDLMVTSETGSGKTHAFLIPIFQSLDENNHSLQYLISSPTRELAKQIFVFARQMADFSPTPIDIRLFIGGSDRPAEISRLKKSQPQIVIGTPGKLKDLVVKENLLDVHMVKTFIVDEADMTLDEGFLEDVDYVAAKMDSHLQTLVFSATMPEKIQPFLRKYLKNPLFIEISKKNQTSLNISHYFVKTKGHPRDEVLKNVLKTINPYFAIVFCNKKESADIVYQIMVTEKYNVGLLHGGLEARKRKQVLTNVREQKYQYLVATDLLSRGIDIADISHIINYELPTDWEFYVHRTGRTGRMDKDGIAISLYDRDDDDYIDMLEARGLKTAYKEIVNNVLVDGKVRSERQKRVQIVSEAEKKAIRVVPKTMIVKPGYKKKYQKQVADVKSQFRRKRDR